MQVQPFAHVSCNAADDALFFYPFFRSFVTLLYFNLKEFNHRLFLRLYLACWGSSRQAARSGGLRSNACGSQGAVAFVLFSTDFFPIYYSISSFISFFFF